MSVDGGARTHGPLRGITVVEIAALGPAPFCGMLLADLGADVIRVERASGGGSMRAGTADVDVLLRGRRSIAVDLKRPEGVEIVLDLVASADALIEGFRPGVMERLGLGPDACRRRNPRLVYGRMTGFGQDGPLAMAAGHDINYIALAGCLAHLGDPAAAPIPPLNLVGDFGGGGMLLALGVAVALVEAARSGEGQVVDAAMVDGAALLMAPFHAPGALGPRGTNIADGAAYFYRVYECADREFVSIGSIEPQFHAELRRLLDLTDVAWNDQMDHETWSQKADALAAIFRTRSQAEWCQVLEGTDVCFAPVLSMHDAREHPHNRARGTFVEVDGVGQPGPAPRFSRTPNAVPRAPVESGANTEEILIALGYSRDQIERLRSAAIVASGVGT